MMSVSSHPHKTIDERTSEDLLKPMQFKTVLLVTCGLKNCQIAEFLGTTEMVIKNVLKDVYDRTGGCNSGELVRRCCPLCTTGGQHVLHRIDV